MVAKKIFIPVQEILSVLFFSFFLFSQGKGIRMILVFSLDQDLASFSLLEVGFKTVLLLSVRM